MGSPEPPGTREEPGTAARELRRLLGQVPFDAATFGTASNNGQMIAEVAASNRINDIFRWIADRDDYYGLGDTPLEVFRSIDTADRIQGRDPGRYLPPPARPGDQLIAVLGLDAADDEQPPF